MKKYIFAIAVVLGVASANASYLYWQVNSGDTDISGQKFNGNDITGFQIVAISSSSQYSSTSADRHVLDSYSIDATTAAYTKDTNPVSWDAATLGDNYADVSTYGTGYSYYIEIVGANSVILGQSSTPITYEAASTSGNIVSDLGGTALSQMSATMWQGGNAYAVPEPTGAMLMIFGLAMLGLKRRKA